MLAAPENRSSAGHPLLKILDLNETTRELRRQKQFVQRDLDCKKSTEIEAGFPNSGKFAETHPVVESRAEPLSS